MNRRELFKAVAGLAACGFAVTSQSPERWGAVDIARHQGIKRTRGLDLRVFHRGEDITGRCFFFDDKADYASAYKHNNEGRAYIDRATNRAARETVRGIEIRAVRLR
jgi:hypothetical protein